MHREVGGRLTSDSIQIGVGLVEWFQELKPGPPVEPSEWDLDLGSGHKSP